MKQLNKMKQLTGSKLMKISEKNPLNVHDGNEKCKK